MQLHISSLRKKLKFLGKWLVQKLHDREATPRMQRTMKENQLAEVAQWGTHGTTSPPASRPFVNLSDHER